jgi:hypothetical protein
MKEFPPMPVAPLEARQEKNKWHAAIQAEREKNNTHTRYFEFPVDAFLSVDERNNALVLGDASHVVTSTLVNSMKFEHATVIDGDPLVLDDYLMPENDKRYTKVHSIFSDYMPPEDSFDFIYGKSIAFTPRQDIETVLRRLRNSLKKSGLFCAVFTGEGDSWRPYPYTREELEDLFVKTGFLLINYQDRERKSNNLVGDSVGTAHELLILARRGDTDSLIFTFPET